MPRARNASIRSVTLPPSVYLGRHWCHSRDKWYQVSPSVFAYCKRSKTGRWEQELHHPHKKSSKLNFVGYHVFRSPNKLWNTASHSPIPSLPYSGKVSLERTFTNWWKEDFVEFCDCSLVPQKMRCPQILQGKRLQIATKPWNSQKFSPLLAIRYFHLQFLIAYSMCVCVCVCVCVLCITRLIAQWKFLTSHKTHKC